MNTQQSVIKLKIQGNNQSEISRKLNISRQRVSQILSPTNKIRARRAVNNAIKNNKLLKPKKCTYCLKGLPLQGHHDNYDEYLSVIWLCPDCHSFEHQTQRVFKGEISIEYMSCFKKNRMKYKRLGFWLRIFSNVNRSWIDL